eukprot:UN01977
MGMIVVLIWKTINSLREEIEVKNAGGSYSEKPDFTIILKIFFSYLQFNSLANKFSYEYPPIISGILATQEAPATITNGILNIDCLVSPEQNEETPTIFLQSFLYLILTGRGILTVFNCIL